MKSLILRVMVLYTALTLAFAPLTTTIKARGHPQETIPSILTLPLWWPDSSGDQLDTLHQENEPIPPASPSPTPQSTEVEETMTKAPTSNRESVASVHPQRAPLASAQTLDADYVYTDTTGMEDLNSYPCSGPAVLTITVSDIFTVGDVDVGINLNHEHRGDILIRLESPAGTLVPVIQDPNIKDPSVNYDVRVDDVSPNPRDDGDDDNTAYPYYERSIAPVTHYLNTGGLNAFEGEAAEGIWQLHVCDQNTGAHNGNLRHWTLFFREPAPAFDRLGIKGAPYKVETGDVITYALYLRNTGSLTASQLFISDSLPSGVAQRAPATFAPSGGATTILSSTTDPITWYGSIPPGGILVADIPVDVTASAPAMVTNTAVISDPALAAPIAISATSQIYPANMLHYYYGINGWTGSANDRTAAGNWELADDWRYFFIPLPIIGPPTAHSGLLAFGTNLGSAYNDDVTSVMTGVLDLTTIPSDREVTLQWWEWLDMASNDEAYVEIASTSYPTPTLFYGQYTGGLTAEQVAHERRWFEVARDITRYRGQTITLTFNLAPNNDGSTAAGWTIDDIGIHLAPGRPNFEHSRKVATPSIGETGRDLTYTLYIHNSGPVASTGGYMSDTLPENVSLNAVSLNGPGTLISDTGWLAWQSAPADPLPAGETATVTVQARLDWGIACGTRLTNTATITDDQTISPIDITAPLPVYSAGEVEEHWDFEASDGGFVPYSGGEWEWGTPDSVYPLGPRTAHSGRRVWGTDLDADASGSGVSHRLTRTLTLPNDPKGVYLSWWDWFDKNLGDIRRIFVDGTEVWSDSTKQRTWTFQTADLSDWAGQTVELAFDLWAGGSDPGLAGWYIDDVSLHAGCQRLMLAPQQCQSTCPGNPITYPLTLKNASHQDDFIALAIDGKAWPASIIPSELFQNSGASDPLTATGYIPWTVDPGTYGAFTITARMQNGRYADTLRVEAMADLGSGWDRLADTVGTRYHGLAYHDGYLYQIGGESGFVPPKTVTPTDAVYRYDIASDSWSARAPLPIALSGVDAVALGNAIYVPGGSDDTETPFYGGTFLDTLHIYNPLTDTWTTGTSLPISLAFASAVELEGKLYVMGGERDNGSYSDALYIYDPASDSWSQGASMNEARAYAGAGVIDGQIYVAGGYAGEAINRDSLEIYDPAMETWREGPNLPMPLTSVGSSVVDDRYLVLAGGNIMEIETYRCSNHAWAFDAMEEHWFPLPELNRCLYGTALAGDGTDIYLVSGRTNEGGWHMAAEAERLSRCALPPAVAWGKEIEGQTWTPGFTRSVAIGDHLEVVDRLSATQALTLSESWDPDQLELFTYTLDPPEGSGLIFQGAWRLEAETPFAYARADAEYSYATGLVYILGGRVSSGDDVGRVWAFDPRTGVYTDTGVDMPQAVSNYEIARLVDNQGREVMLTFGGYLDESRRFTDLVQGYYPDTNSTTVFGSDPLPVKAIAGGVAVVDNKAYVFGGTDGSSALDKTYIFDISRPAGSRWSTGPDLNLARRYIPNAVVDGVIYALGGDIIGGPGLIPVTLTEKLDTGSGAPAWDDAGVANLPVACDEAPAFGFDSALTHTLAGSVVIAGCGHWTDESALSLRYDTQRDAWEQSFPALNMARRNHAGALVPPPGDGDIGFSHAVPTMWVWGGRADNDANILTRPERYVVARLDWSATAGTSGTLTLTKHFTVAACTWSEALLDEQVWIGGGLLERRDIHLQKPPADLEIGGVYKRKVGGGQTITFTLRYTNTSSREPDVEVRADFPAGTRFIEADYTPQAWDGADGGWARWEVEWLAASEVGAWVVTMAISEGVSIGDALPVKLSIYDHAGILHDVVTLDFTVICQGLTGISLQPFTPGTLYIGTPVTLSADMDPDGFTRPYTYTLNFDDGLPPITAQSGDDPLVVTRTYATTGTHDVQIWAWNCTLAPHEALSDWLPLTLYTPGICVSPSGVSIYGAERGQPGSLPGSYTFNAAYTPWDATLPMQFEWDSGESSAQVTRTLGIGVHTLAVTATNDCGQVTATHVITVSPCISVHSVDLFMTGLGTVYTSSIVELRALISPTEATPPYQYIFDGEPVDTTDQNTLALTRTFSTTGTHRVEMRAWNCTMDQSQAASDSVTITVQEQGGCVGVNTLDIHGAKSGDPGLYTFTTTYQPQDATLPLGYLWNNGDMDAEVTRWLNEGRHTLALTATNACSRITATHSITINAAPVCTQVTGVDLAVTSVGTTYTDTVVMFKARLIPDDARAPYTYMINGSSPHMGMANPLVFTQTFPTTGTHTTTVAIWNCGMLQADAVTASVTVTVRAKTEKVALKHITIQGATTGTPGNYTFTTHYTPPDASTPITYLWDSDEDTASSTRTLERGTHTLTVTATNPVNAVTDTHTITIYVTTACTQVTEVNLDSVSAGTIYTNTMVEFTSDLVPDDASPPYTYTINSGSIQTGTSHPLVFIRTFPTTGTHTIEIAVWNCAMPPPAAVTDRISVTVEARELSSNRIYLPLVLRQ